jgi:hypothetical protein
LARNFYLPGITNKRILQHFLQGGGPADKDKKEIRRWKEIYGAPFDLFVLLSDTFEAWLGFKGRQMYPSHALPFKLRVIFHFRQLRSGGPLHQHQHRECYSLSTTVFREFLFFFLDWLWDIRGGSVSMPTMKDEIYHVENIFCLVGYP